MATCPNRKDTCDCYHAQPHEYGINCYNGTCYVTMDKCKCDFDDSQLATLDSKWQNIPEICKYCIHNKKERCSHAYGVEKTIEVFRYSGCENWELSMDILEEDLSC